MAWAPKPSIKPTRIPLPASKPMGRVPTPPAPKPKPPFSSHEVHDPRHIVTQAQCKACKEQENTPEFVQRAIDSMGLKPAPPPVPFPEAREPRDCFTGHSVPVITKLTTISEMSSEARQARLKEIGSDSLVLFLVSQVALAGGLVFMLSLTVAAYQTPTWFLFFLFSGVLAYVIQPKLWRREPKAPPSVSIGRYPGMTDDLASRYVEFGYLREPLTLKSCKDCGKSGLQAWGDTLSYREYFCNFCGKGTEMGL